MQAHTPRMQPSYFLRDVLILPSGLHLPGQLGVIRFFLALQVEEAGDAGYYCALGSRASLNVCFVFRNSYLRLCVPSAYSGRPRDPSRRALLIREESILTVDC